MNDDIRLTAVVLLTTLGACSFHQSAEKDLTTGAYSRGNGIGVDQVRIESAGQMGKANAFIYGETVNFIFEQVEGLVEEGGKVFPGLSLYITESERDTVLGYPDLFEAVKEGTDLSPLQMQANFTAALPYRNGANYKALITIWDKKGMECLDTSFHLQWRKANCWTLDQLED